VAAVAAKALAFLNSLLLIRWTLPYLGDATFGRLVSATAFHLTILLCDWGLAHGMINRFAARRAALASDSLLAADLSSAFVAAVVLAVGLLGALGAGSFANEYLEANAISNAQGPILVAVVSLVVGPFAVLSKAQTGAGRHVGLYGSQAAGQVASLVITGLLARARFGALPILAAQVVPPALMTVVSALAFYRSTGLGIRLSHATIGRTIACASVGFTPFLSQAGAAVLFFAPPFLVSSLSSPEDATTYFGLSRLTSPALVLTLLLVQPLWSAYARYQSQGDKIRLRTLLAQALALVTVLLVVYVALIYLLLEPTLEFVSVKRNDGMLTWMVVYTCLAALRQALAIAAHGIGRDKLLAATFAAIIVGVTMLPALGRVEGGVAVVLGLMSTMEVALIVVSAIELRRILLPERQCST
jgi:O-antigen/teichoic acid export membrane protein